MMKNKGIQTLRGIGCLMVVFSHIIGALVEELHIGNYNLQKSPFSMLWGGHVGVIIFFLLSGFFFFKPDRTLSLKSYVKTIVNRHIRIYPLFVIVMLIGLIAYFTCPVYDKMLCSEWIGSFWNPPFSWKSFFANLLVLLNSNFDVLNPPIWTLHVEILMVFFLPFWNVILKRFPGILCIIASVIFARLFPIVCFMPVFVIGMSLRKFVLSDSVNKFNNSVIVRIIIFIVSIVMIDFRYMILSFYTGEVRELTIYVVTAIGVSGIVYLLFTANVKNNIFSIIGDYSYEVYLIHFVVLLWNRYLLTQYGFIVYTLVSIVVSLAIAYGLAIVSKWINKKINLVISKKQIPLLK